MKMRRYAVLLGLLLVVGVVLSACGSGGSSEQGGSDNSFKTAMVTDTGGIDDKSFNQSAWEGLTQFGEDNSLKEDAGYSYLQSNSASDYVTNLNRLVQSNTNLIFGIGFKLAEDIGTVADQHKDTHFAIVDSVVDKENVASIVFEEQQGSFLAGVAAAMKSESGKIGFVGGEESELIKKFEAGYVAGAKSVNKDIEVDVQYAGSFGAPDKGKLIASNMYNSGVDVIYHSAGGTGNGVFAQAKDLKNNDPEGNYWVIGVDRDQYEEGQIGDNNVTLTSMLKAVDVAVADIAQQSKDGEFPGGEIVSYGLKDDGINIAETNKDAYTEDIKTAVNEWKQKIVGGDVTAPSTDAELQEYLDSL
ncbi:BMP family protein [Terribacillus sp. DMT04]|uniref:BMP family lipoprotein n=1 Tax=Terribacillus sp. DMT04 TaxID=2850441 RepID=UPI001C2BE348|nr:BMP family ABC transporter substrate-binding protein [Terribacillus sp. DMT04]QXE03151.1 BMP family ABC transporter substrate-binding protein [Terribacillus sp. DMT04]